MAVVLVALAGLAFFLNQQNFNAAVTPTPEPARYVWEETEPVSAIDVMSGTQSVVLRQDLTTTVWSILEPISDTADVFQVGNIADSFKSLQATAIISEVTDLAQFGLDAQSTQVKVGFGSAGTTTHNLKLGKTTIDGSGYYAQADDTTDTVYVVSNGVIEPLKSWLTTPPKAQPTPTPLALTVAPTFTSTPAGTPTSTGANSITGTTTLTSTTEITSSAPGAANPTTPLPGTPTTAP